jgi:hypothetical protein
MTPNRSSVVCELEREIASLPVEDKLRLRDYIDRQIKSSAPGRVEIDPDTEDWTDEEWRDFSLQGLSKAYGDDEPDYELLETQELKAI